jgi:hypothetical protein
MALVSAAAACEIAAYTSPIHRGLLRRPLSPADYPRWTTFDMVPSATIGCLQRLQRAPNLQHLLFTFLKVS